MMKPWLLLATPLLLAGCDDLVGFGSCTHERNFDEVIGVGPADAVRVFAEAGDLRVIGRAGLQEVRVYGTGCSADRYDLDDIDLVVQRTGDLIRVLALVPSGSNINARLDLVVEVPDWMFVEIDDESGDIEVRNVGAVVVFDESGDVLIEDIYGDVDVEDQSGEIEVRRIDGDVWLWDESGDILVETVLGDLNVESDSSGRLTYRDIRGRVRTP